MIVLKGEFGTRRIEVRRRDAHATVIVELSHAANASSIADVERAPAAVPRSRVYIEPPRAAEATIVGPAAAA
jgi:hypothetical protein